MTLSPSDYAETLRSSYYEERKKVNFLIIGQSGTGKTVLTETCPAPTHIDSFDPGGTVSVRASIHDNRIIADTSFEREDTKKPWAYRKWASTMHERLQMNYFDWLGTYVLDSLTTFGEAVMNWVLQKNKNMTGTPNQQDYLHQMNTIREEIEALTRLPCNVLVTAHVDAVRDELTGQLYGGLLTTGKLKGRLPLYFDEVLYTLAKPSNDGAKYYIVTGLSGIYQARSRLAREGGDNRGLIEPSIRELLKKGGYPYEDKELK